MLTFWIVPDTSCILAWLIEEGYEVYAFMADVGQEEVWTSHMVRALLTRLRRITMPPGRRPSRLVQKGFSLRSAQPIPIRFPGEAHTLLIFRI